MGEGRGEGLMGMRFLFKGDKNVLKLMVVKIVQINEYPKKH